MDEMKIPESRTDGDCFLVAVQLGTRPELLSIFHGFADVEAGDVRIVHGLPVGRGTLNAGRRFWHAWVEVIKRVRIPDVPEAADMRRLLGEEHELVFVVDCSNGLDVTLPRELYYARGGLDEEHVWRFTREEAWVQMGRMNHYGPWVDGWESMEEVR